ncbi:Acetyltransferase (GNAT) family protein OS=Ureibacillus acetophenoni OX=614649 GN=SAMN05877842_10698 PE=4 SV=1 [Ureibacillus acetophenoni]
MIIRELNNHEKPPMDLLLLADPSIKIVEGYFAQGKLLYR